MTIKTVCAVFDSATRAYTAPFLVSRPAEAMRLFTIEVNRGTSDERQPNMLNTHSDDYELHQLALFDDETGKYENTLQAICRAKDVLRLGAGD